MTTKQSRKEKGQSLVEMSIGFTLLLLIVGGIFDLGMMFYSYISLRDTAQEGAVYSAYNPIDTNGIVSRIHASATFPINAAGLNDITILCDGVACSTTNIHSCPGKTVDVTVRYNYQIATPMMSTLLGKQSIVLDATVTQTILQSPNTITTLAAQSPAVSCYP